MLRKKLNSIFAASDALYFLMAMIIFGISTGIFMGVLNNFLHEVLEINKAERGMVEFPRELPGLLLVVIISLLYRFSETRILRVAFLVSLMGIVGLVLAGDIRWIAIIMIVLWSTGEHILMPLRQSIAMHKAQKGKAGLALGMVRGAQNVGQLTGYFLIPVLFYFLSLKHLHRTFPGFRWAYIVAGVMLLSGFIFTELLHDRNLHVKRQRFCFKKKYWRYYVLELFFGARKQVFLTFAPFVLVVTYGKTTETLGTLLGIAAGINIFVAPFVGRLMDKIGYRKIIITDTILLVILCVLYGFIHHLLSLKNAFYVIAVVFILDCVLFVVTLARSMYVKQISDSRDEVTATLSTGISINHLISILIAIAGGFLWQYFGIEVLFSLAAVFGLGSCVFALSLPKPRPVDP